MTIVILDRTGEWLDRHARRLHELPENLVVFTGRAPSKEAAQNRDVRFLADYSVSATLETRVLELADLTRISEIRSTDNEDTIRAGALREYLGIPGQGRDSALTFRDLITMRQRLVSAGIPSIPCGPVRRAADTYRFAHRWGFPLRVRRRRVAGWPSVAILHDEGELNDHGAFSYIAPGKVQSLVAEPGFEGERHRIIGTAVPGDRWVVQNAPSDVRALAAAALTALPTFPARRFLVEVIRNPCGDPLVDSASATEEVIR